MTILQMIYKRLTRLFVNKVYVTDEGPVSGDDDVEANLPMPFRPHAPKADLHKGHLLANPLYQHPGPDVMSVRGWCNVRYRWFSLHAAVKIEGTGRACLRQLFHLLFVGGARSSVNLSLLSYVEPDDPDQGSSELAQLD